MGRGSLRIYLGAAPGVGKTYRMLGEAARRHDRGTDVVIGIVETHGRAQTIAQLSDLEQVPRREHQYRGTTLLEMDTDAVLTRRPQVLLVDELAHTNAPGSPRQKRWQDVEVLLDAGIDVIATLNIQHLESLNDVIGRITGTVQRETVPDQFVRCADQIELVDMAPEALRRRMAHGNIYPPERIDAALSNYFRPGNLGALRELALLWVADRVEESLSTYLSDHGITDAWETRERVVVGITGAPGGDALIRRAARIAGRLGGELIGAHVTSDDGLHVDDETVLAQQRQLITELGGTAREVVGADRAAALVTFARTERATQLVLGATRRSRWYELTHGSFIATVTRLAADAGSGGIDVHVIATDAPTETSPLRGRDRPPVPIAASRISAAWALALIGLPLLTVAGTALREHVELPTTLLVFLTWVLLIAAVGGRLVAAIAAVEASLLVNWYFVEPRHTFTIAQPENVTALIVFVVVAFAVGSLVDTASRRSLEARVARFEAEALTRSAASLSTDAEPMPALVDEVRSIFGLASVRLVRTLGTSSEALAESFAPGAATAGHELVVPFGVVAGDEVARYELEVRGRALSDDDQRLLRVLADQLAVAVGAQQLARDAAEASALAEVDAVRTGMLRAVSHDLRTPLASIKAMVSGLRDDTVAWTPDQTAEALATIDEETDRLNRLVGNLLDASRLQIGALAVRLEPTAIGDVVSSVLHVLAPGSSDVAVDIDPALPLASCDPVLLERSVANVVSNALHHAGADVRINASVVGSSIHLAIIDRGPGIPESARVQVLAPFQRLGDQQTVDGVGLGLSIAQGFVEAMGGTLTLDDTPGGGLTVVITLGLADGVDGVAGQVAP